MGLSSMYERSPLPTPAPLRILMVDGHSAPLNEAGFFLRATLANVSIDPYAYYAYAEYAAVSRDKLLPAVARTELRRVIGTCLPKGECLSAALHPQRRYLTPSTSAAIEGAVDVSAAGLET